MGVPIPMVAAKAAQVSESFNDKPDWPSATPPAGLFVVHRVLSFALGQTNPSACPRKLLQIQWICFIVSVVRPNVSEPTRHQDYILNMDQTPVPFTYNARKTLEIVGRRAVHIRIATGDTKRATFAMTVTASGRVLKPVIIF
jgi:hypothetical protein